ncbi:hypothetical protein JL722_14157 [Aureococcus anophagefferens]|nr:hypothetical protein JL722_14157 [Aureococcus anophagefferens]
MRAVSATKPHYVRCLKPNDDNVPDAFWRVRVAEQLRYGGVLEAVRVARSGFPCACPTPSSSATTAPRGRSHQARRPRGEALIAVAAANAGFAADQAQLGKTKVFLRKHAHDALETDRAARAPRRSSEAAAAEAAAVEVARLAAELEASKQAREREVKDREAKHRLDADAARRTYDDELERLRAVVDDERAKREAAERDAAAAAALATKAQDALALAELEATELKASADALHELRQRVGEEARRREAAEAALESARRRPRRSRRRSPLRQSLAKKMDGAGPGFAADWEDDDEGEEDPSSPAAPRPTSRRPPSPTSAGAAQFLDKLRRGGAHVALWEDHAASGEAKPAAPLPLAALYGARRGHCGICGLADRDDGLEEARFVALLAEART